MVRKQGLSKSSKTTRHKQKVRLIQNQSFETTALNLLAHLHKMSTKWNNNVPKLRQELQKLCTNEKLFEGLNEFKNSCKSAVLLQ